MTDYFEQVVIRKVINGFILHIRPRGEGYIGSMPDELVFKTAGELGDWIKDNIEKAMKSGEAVKKVDN